MPDVKMGNSATDAASNKPERLYETFLHVDIESVSTQTLDIKS
jgi:hypothetical protein